MFERLSADFCLVVYVQFSQIFWIDFKCSAPSVLKKSKHDQT